MLKPDANLSSLKSTRVLSDNIVVNSLVALNAKLKHLVVKTGLVITGAVEMMNLTVTNLLTAENAEISQDLTVQGDATITNEVVTNGLTANSVTATQRWIAPSWTLNNVRAFPLYQSFVNFVPGIQDLNAASVNLDPTQLLAGIVRLHQTVATPATVALTLPSATDLVSNLSLETGDMFELTLTIWRDADPVYKEVQVLGGTGSIPWDSPADVMTSTFNNFATFHFYINSPTSYYYIRAS